MNAIAPYPSYQQPIFYSQPNRISPPFPPTTTTTTTLKNADASSPAQNNQQQPSAFLNLAPSGSPVLPWVLGGTGTLLLVGSGAFLAFTPQGQALWAEWFPKESVKVKPILDSAVQGLEESLAPSTPTVQGNNPSSSLPSFFPPLLPPGKKGFHLPSKQRLAGVVAALIALPGGFLAWQTATFKGLPLTCLPDGNFTALYQKSTKGITKGSPFIARFATPQACEGWKQAISAKISASATAIELIGFKKDAAQFVVREPNQSAAIFLPKLKKVLTPPVISENALPPVRPLRLVPWWKSTSEQPKLQALRSKIIALKPNTSVAESVVLPSVNPTSKPITVKLYKPDGEGFLVAFPQEAQLKLVPTILTLNRKPLQSKLLTAMKKLGITVAPALPQAKTVRYDYAAKKLLIPRGFLDANNPATVQVRGKVMRLYDVQYEALVVKMIEAVYATRNNLSEKAFEQSEFPFLIATKTDSIIAKKASPVLVQVPFISNDETDDQRRFEATTKWLKSLPLSVSK